MGALPLPYYVEAHGFRYVNKAMTQKKSISEFLKNLFFCKQRWYNCRISLLSISFCFVIFNVFLANNEFKKSNCLINFDNNQQHFYCTSYYRE